MEICIKDNLRRLRTEKNITQEALAKYLGITPQSVGKWERGEGYPDITLLPKIALFFGVTIDDLLNVGKARIDEIINGYMKESAKLKREGENDALLALWEKAYLSFPNDCRVMLELMLSINRRAHWPCPKEDTDRIIYLGEQILEKSTDSKLREETISYLCHVYTMIGEEENALRCVEKGGNIYSTRMGMRAQILEGEAGIKASQEYIATLLFLATLEVGNLSAKDGITVKEKLAADKFSIDLVNLLFSDGNVGSRSQDLARFHLCLAADYAEMNNKEAALQALEDAARYAIQNTSCGAMRYTAPLVNRLSYDPNDTAKNFKGNTCNLLLNMLRTRQYIFAPLTEDARYEKVVTQLEEYAET